MPLIWFAVLNVAVSSGAYLLLAGTLSRNEDVTAAIVGLLTAAFATIRRIRQDRPVTLCLPPPRLLGLTATGLASDTARVGLSLVAAIGSPRRGAATWQAFCSGGRSSSDAGRRALVTLATSLAPNGFVLDVRPSALPEADQAVLLHRLVPAPPLSDKDWPA